MNISSSGDVRKLSDGGINGGEGLDDNESGVRNVGQTPPRRTLSGLIRAQGSTLDNLDAIYAVMRATGSSVLRRSDMLAPDALIGGEEEDLPPTVRSGSGNVEEPKSGNEEPLGLGRRLEQHRAQIEAWKTSTKPDNASPQTTSHKAPLTDTSSVPASMDPLLQPLKGIVELRSDEQRPTTIPSNKTIPCPPPSISIDSSLAGPPEQTEVTLPCRGFTTIPTENAPNGSAGDGDDYFLEIDPDTEC